MIQIETILDILVKGFVIGIVVSAPLGPVGVLCIQRTLNKGRWYGFVTGLGASLSDIAYALLTGYGMSFVFDYINKNIFYLQLLGSIMLLAFGIYTFRSNPVQSIRPVSANKGSYFHNFITAFAVTLSNPLIIFLFIGLFARFAFVQPGVLVFEEITGYLAIALGALAWWFVHRWTVSGREPLLSLLGGKVPVVVVDHHGDESADVYGTITHNRARGTHLLEPMKAIVKKLIDEGKTVEEIGKQLGMKPEEIFRLSGFTKDEFLNMMTKGHDTYSKAQVIRSV